MARGISIDSQYHGDEPTITNKSTDLEVIRAYNWFNYFHDSEDAKKFVLEFLKAKKTDKAILSKVATVDANKLRNIGWNCRILSKGGSLPKHIHKKVSTNLNDLIDSFKPKKVTVTTVSTQEKTAQKLSEYISDLEHHIDVFCKTYKPNFDVVSWFKAREIKPQMAKKIVEHYTPLYDELYEAHQGKSDDLKEAYSHLKKIEIKRYMEFVKAILSACETQTVVVPKKPRKTRAKKAKPATALVSKLKYKEKDETYNVTSVKPADIVGASQLWVFNTKTRNLTVLNASGETGLNVSGTTVVGFDEKTSETKKLRKPEDVIKAVLSSGKIPLRKVMAGIATKPTKVSGRINTETVLLRIIK